MLNLPFTKPFQPLFVIPTEGKNLDVEHGQFKDFQPDSALLWD